MKQELNTQEREKKIALDASLVNELHRYEVIRAQVTKQLAENKDLLGDNNTQYSRTEYFDEFLARYKIELRELMEVDLVKMNRVQRDVMEIFFKVFTNIRSTTEGTGIFVQSRYDSTPKHEITYGKYGFGIKKKVQSQGLVDISSLERVHYFTEFIKKSPEVVAFLRKKKLDVWATKLENFALIYGTANFSDDKDEVCYELPEKVKHVSVYHGEPTCLLVEDVQYSVSNNKINFRCVEVGIFNHTQVRDDLGLAFYGVFPMMPKAFESIKAQLLEMKENRAKITTALTETFAKELMVANL